MLLKIYDFPLLHMLSKNLYSSLTFQEEFEKKTSYTSGNENFLPHG